MSSRKIKIKFSGFYQSFDENNNFIRDSISRFGDVELSDKPDYIFYSVFSNEYLMYPNAIRIFFTGENIAPNFQLCDYAIGFERLSFGDRYLRFPFYYGMYEYKRDLILAEKKNEMVDQKLFERDFCSFVYSNDDTDSMRIKLLECLSDYKKIDCGGKLKNNMPSGPVKDKLDFESKHKFSIACENSSHPGYVTEKLLQAFAAKTIPIYYGDPTVAEDFNQKAFISCHSYQSLEDIKKKVIELDNDETKYKSMLAEPVFNDNLFSDKMKKDFDSFIENIFKQEYDEAFRRNRVFWGKKMDDKYLKLYKIEVFLKKIKNIIKLRWKS